MQLFPVAETPEEIAKSLCDKHVTKITLESAQLYNAALHKNCYEDYTFYKPTHLNHPWTNWAANTAANLFFLRQTCEALGDEHTFRNGTKHTSAQKMKNSPLPPSLEPLAEGEGLGVGGRDPFPLVMPEEYKGTDPIRSYRRYYALDKANEDWAQWSKRQRPSWIKDFEEERVMHAV